jgi:hypothetical protein
MFQMLGLGEKSGSGFPKILRAWREQHWIYPMVSEALDLFRNQACQRQGERGHLEVERLGRHIPGQLSLGDTANASTSIQHSTPSSEHYGPDSEHYDPDSEHYKALLEIAEPIRKKGRANRDLVRQTIQQLCSGRYLNLRTLAELLGREPDSVRNHYVKPMLDAGLLQLKYPAHANHPKQAYRSVN